MIAAQQSRAEKLQNSHHAAEVNRRPKRLPRLHRQQHRQEVAFLELAAESLDQGKDFAPRWHSDRRNRPRRLAGAALA